MLLELGLRIIRVVHHTLPVALAPPNVVAFDSEREAVCGPPMQLTGGFKWTVMHTPSPITSSVTSAQVGSPGNYRVAHPPFYHTGTCQGAKAVVCRASHGGSIGSGRGLKTHSGLHLRRDARRCKRVLPEWGRIFGAAASVLAVEH